MLKIAKSVEYSILALKYIYEHTGNGCVNAKEISEKQEIPFELLAKILQKLVKSEIILSQQGNKGGYIINIDPDKLNMIDLVSAVDQKIQFANCLVENASKEDCIRVENCCIRNPMERIQNKINDVLQSTTLMEIIQ
jgi:Rrf2 family iron-sulfur cluster assembly transcriptional regulator